MELLDMTKLKSVEEFHKAIQSDPLGYHKAVQERGMENLAVLRKTAIEQGTKFIDNYVGALVTSIGLYSEELAIFRTLETHIFNNSLDANTLQNLLAQLKEFRERSRKTAEAFAASAAAKPSTN